MSTMHRIDMACERLASVTEELARNLNSPLYGPITILSDCVKANGFIHPDTNDASRLRKSAEKLRQLADAIDQRGDALEANERHSYHLEAAE